MKFKIGDRVEYVLCKPAPNFPAGEIAGVWFDVKEGEWRYRVFWDDDPQNLSWYPRRAIKPLKNGIERAIKRLSNEV